MFLVVSLSGDASSRPSRHHRSAAPVEPLIGLHALATANGTDDLSPLFRMSDQINVSAWSSAYTIFFFHRPSRTARMNPDSLTNDV
jgi:hypothetical protein